MVVRKRRKVRKMRGRTRSMSWGRVGQHRGPGSHGGHGAAGMHKHRWMWTIKHAPTWFGKHGFNKPFIRDYKVKIINVSELDENAEFLVKQGLAKKDEDHYKINLEELGVHKLGGKGKVTKKLIITAKEATELAVKKIESVGGKVITNKNN
ncbi:MAG: 50S ribosomal protein L15 [Desulfurococcales archaeon]|nr:50S ribosomal protein L15 [Desulfurococcales archaeon]